MLDIIVVCLRHEDLKRREQIHRLSIGRVAEVMNAQVRVRTVRHPGQPVEVVRATFHFEETVLVRDEGEAHLVVRVHAVEE